MADTELGADFSSLDSPDIKRVVVGLSGGVDSVVLLDALVKATELPVVALHINHHLHDEVDEAASFCRSIVSSYAIPVEILDVEVDESGSMETRAREARYSAFDQFLQPGDLLLLAHHADDQVETALFRLFRGSRVFGLEGMPFQRRLGDARLSRPLLALGRTEILAYAESRQLRWYEDPTNADLTPDRNFIRHELLPMIESRFPAAREAILAAVSGDARAREQLSGMWAAQLEPHLVEPDALDLDWLAELPESQMVDLITTWMMRLNVPQVTGRFLASLTEKISRWQTVDETIGEFCMHSFNGHLYLGRQLPHEMPVTMELQDQLPVPGGYISNKQFKGQGLRKGNYEIRYRAGGEKLKVRRGRTLKNLFQEQAVPPWLRDRVPLIYSGSELVAVAGLPGWGVPMMVADGWGAGEGEPGLEISLLLIDRIR